MFEEDTLAVASTGSEKTWNDLLPDILERIAVLLPRNEVVCALRLTNKSAAKVFGVDKRIQLSEPVPHGAFVDHWTRAEVVHSLTLKQRQQLVVLTARSGCLANLDVALAVAGCSLTEKVFSAAAGAGHLESCCWLRAKNCPRAKDALQAAARGGHLAVVRWLLQLERDNRAVSEAWAAAAGAGQRAVCEGLLADGIPPGSEAPIAAAKGGHVDLTRWLLQLPQIQLSLDNGTSNFPVKLFNAASFGFELAALQQLHQDLQASSGIILHGKDSALACALASPTPDWREKVQWLRQEHGCMLTAASHMAVDLGAIASRPDCIERLEPLLPLLKPVPHALCLVLLAAVGAANLLLLRHLREGRPLLPGSTVQAAECAAGAGDVPLLAELVALGWNIRPYAVSEAAKGGHLGVLRWLEEAPEAGQGGGETALREAMSPELVKAAAESSSVEVMKWLRERGCEWHPDTFLVALRAGASPAFLEWLVAAGCPMPDSGEPYLRAGVIPDWVTLRCLRRLGCPWGPRADTFSGAVYHARLRSRCGLEVLKWLLAEGCPVDWGAAWRQAQLRYKDPEAAAVCTWIRSQMAAGTVQGAAP